MKFKIENLVIYQIISLIFATMLCVLAVMYLLVGLYPVELPLMIALGGAGWIFAGWLPTLILRPANPTSASPDGGGRKTAKVLSFSKKTTARTNAG